MPASFPLLMGRRSGAFRSRPSARTMPTWTRKPGWRKRRHMKDLGGPAGSRGRRSAQGCPCPRRGWGGRAPTQRRCRTPPGPTFAQTDRSATTGYGLPIGASSLVPEARLLLRTEAAGHPLVHAGRPAAACRQDPNGSSCLFQHCTRLSSGDQVQERKTIKWITYFAAFSPGIYSWEQGGHQVQCATPLGFMRDLTLGRNLRGACGVLIRTTRCG
jgi:hypothetical protein